MSLGSESASADTSECRLERGELREIGADVTTFAYPSRPPEFFNDGTAIIIEEIH